MPDPRIEKLSEVLVQYSTAVKPGDRVLIQGHVLSEPLIKEIYIQTLQAGGHPLVIPQLPGMGQLFMSHASDDQLKHIPEPLKMALEIYDVAITIMGSDNTKELSNVAPDRLQLSNQARSELMKTMMQRMGDGSLRWVGTQFPMTGNAQDADMSLREYEDMVYGACLPDMNDPVGYWKRFSSWQEKIVQWLKGKDTVHVTGRETDLRLKITGRSFMNCNGRQNMPDGEVCTSPVEDSMNGHVCFSYPTIYQGREVTGVRLWFENGKVVKAAADKGGEFLQSVLDTDEGSRLVGEFAIGTNEGITKFTRSILFDEKINGSFHMAIGAGLPEAGGKNESAIHWDMICDLREGGEIRVDDELLYKNGSFVIDF